MSKSTKPTESPKIFNKNDADMKYVNLTIDEEIRGQRFCCISFAEPVKNVLAEKESYMFSQFIPKFLDKFYNDFCFMNGLDKTKMKQPKVSLKQINEDYLDFQSTNFEKLSEDFKEQNKQMNIRAVKVRGNFDTLEEAQMKARQLQQEDPHFDIFVGQVGYWLPFNPANINDIKPEYMNEELNKLVHGHIENQKNMKKFYNERKKRQMEQNLTKENTTHQQRKEVMKI